MTAIDRLTAALDAERGSGFFSEITAVSRADLAAVLAVVEAARTWENARHRWLVGEMGDDNGFLVDEAVLALRAALARIES